MKKFIYTLMLSCLCLSGAHAIIDPAMSACITQGYELRTPAFDECMKQERLKQAAEQEKAAPEVGTQEERTLQYFGGPGTFSIRDTTQDSGYTLNY